MLAKEQIEQIDHLDSFRESKRTDFRLLLQQEFVRKCKVNPRYSLRAFSKFLGIESSRLSKILKGQRPVNPTLIEQFGKRLGLSPSQIEEFKTHRKAVAAGLDVKQLENKNKFFQISQDAFEIICDYQHYAVLELIKVKHFEPNTKWLSKILNTSKAEMEACVDRLVRVGLLEIDPKGKWIDKSDGFTTHSLGENYTSYAHKKAQEQILHLSLKALNEVSIEARGHSSMMMATNTEKILEAKKMITQFRQALCSFLEDCDEKNAVYELAVSIFPITEITGSKK